MDDIGCELPQGSFHSAGIEFTAGANTGGLKLASRKNVKLSEFRLSTIRLKLQAYDSIMPIIERAMRCKLNPIAGT